MNTITIGNGVKNIGSQSFANCPKLTDVFCYVDNVPSMIDWYGNPCTNAFMGSNIEKCILHVPQISIEAYQATEPWRNFMYIVALTEGDPQPAGIMATGYIENKKDIIFNLNGCRVKQLKRGLFIKNGKKYVAK